MNEKSKPESRLEITDAICLKLDQLSAIVSSLVALGLSAASQDSLSFVPAERTEDTFLALGQMANQLHEELKLHNDQLSKLE
jgi:hypothetical protein